jgi:anthranilate phosphoribosyltransferase
MLADLTARVATHELSRDEIAQAMFALLDEMTSDDARAAFLAAWAPRGETAAELAACAEALLPRAITPPVRGSWNGKPLLDCCGTGGGGLNLVNISTAAVFVLAAMGIPVVKHGNRGLTKKSGSADVLEALGIRIDLPPESMEACLAEVGAAFLFAPAYHTSFSVLAPVRQKLGSEGQRTVFNLLGPLLNPARPDARLVGVFSEENLYLYEQALAALGCPNFEVVCGEDASTAQKIGEASGNGETLLTGTRMVEGVTGFTMNAENNQSFHLDSMIVSSAAESAAQIEAALAGGETTLTRETLLLNAAIAAWAQGHSESIEAGQAAATEAIDSRAAQHVLRNWRAFSK